MLLWLSCASHDEQRTAYVTCERFLVLQRRPLVPGHWGGSSVLDAIVPEADQTNRAGLEGLTRAYAHRLAGEGVTVNGIAPGLIDTDMGRSPIEAGLPTHIPMDERALQMRSPKPQRSQNKSAHEESSQNSSLSRSRGPRHSLEHRRTLHRRNRPSTPTWPAAMELI